MESRGTVEPRRLGGDASPYPTATQTMIPTLGRILRAAALAASAAVLAPAAERPAIRWQTEAATPVVEVTGLPAPLLARLAGDDEASAAERQRVLVVYAEQPGDLAMPPMAGAWSVADGRLRFVPRFPPVRGVRYRAEFRAGDAPAAIAFFSLPADTAAPSTTVRRISPTTPVLPENQLKFYVEFSAPMSRGATYGQVQLRAEGGALIDLPFLELDEELWDPSMTRLTLLIDPGRIKRGVKPLEDIGPVFEAGRRYVLSVGAGCRDAAGRPLRAGYEQRFAVGPADRTPPDPARWTVSAPGAGTRAPLTVDFGEAMDEALALRLITVADAAGRALEGEPALADGERRWSFVPAQPWRGGEHRLVVGTTIEDLAGNNIGKTFDVDVNAGAPRRIERSTVEVAFAVR